MEIDETNYQYDSCSSSINNLILDYYKKFGRKRDIEQFFSLSTAKSDHKDPTSLFWRRMKNQNDSSDSGDKNESSTELCRISIKCSLPETSGLQEHQKTIASDNESPPIVNELNVQGSSNNSEDEINKSEDEQSQKSIEMTLDNSINKLHSPTSSVTSQRKLEWDSLADVGYANESDRKNSASSLSTLERLALHQQYSNSDTKPNSDVGGPTAHSTPVDQSENKQKTKKDISKKSTKIFKKDIDYVEVNVPQCSDTQGPISVNLTKHILFNVERDGEIKIDNITKNISLSPEKPVEPEDVKMDKEIQTTLNRNQEKDMESVKPSTNSHKMKYPVIINLNTFKKRHRRRKIRRIPKQHKKKLIINKDIKLQEKAQDQVSDAESFEYMPGHMYDQNKRNDNVPALNMSDNKSSLESSAGNTTESSKRSQMSFTKDLEKSIDLLKKALHHRYEDSELKKKLIKEVVQRLIHSKYRCDESGSDFLSSLNFSNKNNRYNHTTSSTSDNNVDEKPKLTKPRKSILRTDNKITLKPIATTSQSVPNLPLASTNDTPIFSNLSKQISTTSTESDISRKTSFSTAKTSSEELYKQYLESLKKEEEYKKHLRSKEIFLRQKLSSSEAILNVEKLNEIKTQNRLKNLMNDLTRNNYDDGSGDASKLECGSSSYTGLDNYALKKHRSHSVFTLSSGNSETQTKSNIRDRLQNEIHNSLAEGSSRLKKYCSCTYKKGHGKVSVTDSSCQVNIRDNEKTSIICKENRHHKHCLPIDKGVNEKKTVENRKESLIHTQQNPESASRDIKYVCLCGDDADSAHVTPENILIYKCSRLPNKCFMIGSNPSEMSSSKIQTTGNSPLEKVKNLKSSDYCEDKCLIIKSNSNNASSKSSQTNMNLPLMLRSGVSSSTSEDINVKKNDATNTKNNPKKNMCYIHEATRWVQTEISFDPKLSDPSLNDIRIVNDNNCVKLVKECLKEVSPPNSDYNVNKQVDEEGSYCKGISSKSASEESDISKLACLDKKSNKQDIGIQSNFDESNKLDNPNILRQNDFTIPIQGTNMTLKVSLGSDDKPIPTSTCESLSSRHQSYVSKGVETIRNKLVENATSLQEECSKGVQSENIQILDDFNNNSKETCQISCKVTKETLSPSLDTRKVDVVSKTNSNIDPIINTVNKIKCSTYPKTSNIQKTLLRSNTDTGRMENIDHVSFKNVTQKDANTQHENSEIVSSEIFTNKENDEENVCNREKSFNTAQTSTSEKNNITAESQSQSKKSDSDSECCSKDLNKDPVLEMIKDITRRYSKNSIEKSKRKKCFREIITVLNYLLDTEDNIENIQNRKSTSSTSDEVEKAPAVPLTKSQQKIEKTFKDKGIQLSTKRSKMVKTCTDSSELPISSDMPSTSDSTTCKVLNKIKKECEKYHQRRCKCNSGMKRCEASSSTSMNCEQCQRAHHCFCRGHRCKSHKCKNDEKGKKKCVAYNLIIQTSDSIMSEEVQNEKCGRPLKNIIVKVPSKHKVENLQFKELASKLERNYSRSPSCSAKAYRSRSLPNDSEISSTDEILRKSQVYTVREYLEKNRPDFVEKSSKRQNCLKVINEARNCDTPNLKMIVVHTPNCTGYPCTGTCNVYCGGVPNNNCNCYQNLENCDKTDKNPCCEVTRIGEFIMCFGANEQSTKRQLLSMQLARHPTVAAVSETDLRGLAKELGKELRNKKVAPKFISEKEMKKHSEKIYKSLPEAQRKKEEMKKENIKKTNLLMANLFKKNLQKKTLRGTVNISNYSAVIKI